MPQSSLHNLRSQPPILLAQGETGGAPGTERPVAETTAAEGHGGEKNDVGAVPDAALLFTNAVMIALIMVAFALAARRKLEAVPKGFQNFAEWIAESLNRFTVGIIGEGGEKYTPLVGTIFLYIFLMNMLSVVPGFHAPTANLSTTLALGVVVFVYVQYQGIRNNGLGGYLKHFVGPMPALSPLIMPVELISEFIKPFTLAVRLFGNIFGEDVILLVLAGLTTTMGMSYLSWLPIQFPVMLLATLTAFVQAMVFAILTCIYLSLMSHHEHGEHGEEGPIDDAHSHATGH
jgi:F-type H+-transporting ATPase subunit a